MIPTGGSFATKDCRPEDSFKKPIDVRWTVGYNHRSPQGARSLSYHISQEFSRILRMADLLVDGINFFNTGRYFQAHESWEDLWRETKGPLRLFYQGLVQAA